MKLKSIVALGLLMLTVSAPLFADDASNTDNQANQSSDDQNQNQKSDANDMNATDKSDEGSQDTATGDDDY